MKTTITIPKDIKYLSEFIDRLPSNCIINKGVTGCGGTTVELESKRNSIILCPTKNLVESKSGEGRLSVTGETNNQEIIEYINSDKTYKKIVATYDALERLMNLIPDYFSYFLLIDEYHLLFNDYSFRTKAIMYILHNFLKFSDWAFMTATPLKDEFILEELKDVDQIVYVWENATPVHIIVNDTTYIQKKLLELIETLKDRNLHIFLNSVSTIYNITKDLDYPYRVICSDSNKSKIFNRAKITSPVKKLNFYTSCSFEGADIYDEDGFTIIVCDTNISTTVLDIATKIRQICGRIRNSKYKDQCVIFLNTNRHRYAGTTKTEFDQKVAISESTGKNIEELFNSVDDKKKNAMLRVYGMEYTSNYISKFDGKLFYDINLKNQDLYNYDLISEIYDNSISVVNALNKVNLVKATRQVIPTHKAAKFVENKLRELNRSEYSYDDLAKIFTPVFEEQGLQFNKNTSIKIYFPLYKKKTKKIYGERKVYYIFDL